MSSVEQKIREVLENVAIEYGEYPSPKTINVDQAIKALLDIVDKEVIGEDDRTLYEPEDGHDEWDASRNDLRAEQRAKLKGDENE